MPRKKVAKPVKAEAELVGSRGLSLTGKIHAGRRIVSSAYEADKAGNIIRWRFSDVDGASFEMSPSAVAEHVK